MVTKMEENLTNGEKILVKAEQDKIILIVGGVITVLLLVAAWPLAILWLLFIYRAWIVSYLTNNLCITNKRVYGSTGLIKKQELDIPIDKVNTISTSKGLFGAIHKYETVTIKSYGDGWTFPQVKNAQEIKKVFYEQQEKKS